jgi:MFS family permease
VALAVVLVAVQPATEAQRATDTSLERSGVRVVEPAASSGESFEDPGSALLLALGAIGFGLVAGIALGAAADRYGRLPMMAVAGFGVSVGVLALADRATWRDVGAQAAFWSVTAGWLWWSDRDGARSSRLRP